MFRWKKKGLIFSPKDHGINGTHAQVPTLLLKGDVLRVYFSFRPEKGLSLTTFVDIDVNDLSKVVYVHSEPILKLGLPGTFDEHGIMPSSVIKENEKIYMYYSGWQRGVSVPYNNYTGLAISEDGGMTFTKYTQGPVLDRTLLELYSATSPLVLIENGKWHAWYSSGTNWHFINGKYEHTYDLKYASSNDGINWLQNNKVAIAQKSEFEAITRPAIFKDNNGYHMWYSYRGTIDFRTGIDNGYKIGYAFSDDLLKWKRDDTKAGIELSENGWDSKMMAYPAIIKIRDKIIMVYNGNDFGSEGFGYAELSYV